MKSKSLIAMILCMLLYSPIHSHAVEKGPISENLEVDSVTVRAFYINNYQKDISKCLQLQEIEKMDKPDVEFSIIDPNEYKLLVRVINSWTPQKAPNKNDFVPIEIHRGDKSLYLFYRVIIHYNDGSIREVSCFQYNILIDDINYKSMTFLALIRILDWYYEHQ